MSPIDAFRILSAVGRHRRASQDQLVQFQHARLRRLIGHAYDAVPFYRALFQRHGIRPEHIRTTADLPLIPVTSKRELQGANPTELVARGLDPSRLIAYTLPPLLVAIATEPNVAGESRNPRPSGDETVRRSTFAVRSIVAIWPSVVAHMMAGYSLIYRRTFRVGDRVKIQDVVGDVTMMGLQVTHVRTIKNEDVVVPNSAILTSQVVNYSSFAAGDGLILHATVGIGYEVPWRQVEAMLLLAASRTPGLRTAPPPFVLQTSLGDFAVNYELNAYCDDAHAMAALYTELHRSVQDVFNEYGVQIMTPAYRGDPATPKVVPKDQWFQAPARTLEEPPRSAAG